MATVSPQDLNLASPAANFRSDVLHGLSARNKTLPSKYLYDETGSRLFDQICELSEYYPTRTELAILRQHGARMAAMLGDNCLLIEFGSGSSLKTRLLLDHLTPAAYIPIDISCEPLMESARSLARDYPHLDVRPVCADFTRPVELPELTRSALRRVVYFPGSTIGNFTPNDARALLQSAAHLCGSGGAMLLGADLKKNPRLIEAAYNDREGITAAFNLNLLVRINRELDGDFELGRFWHHALYNPREGRIEMHLVSRQEQRVGVAGQQFFFVEGESICTEYSYKYSLRGLRDLAEAAGFAVERVWTDDHRLFSAHYLTVRDAARLQSPE
ncbi:MAG: L-histidine N(alpha)-methyltransferase [Candidatus Binataceae bacterium]